MTPNNTPNQTPTEPENTQNPNVTGIQEEMEALRQDIKEHKLKAIDLLEQDLFYTATLEIKECLKIIKEIISLRGR